MRQSGVHSSKISSLSTPKFPINALFQLPNFLGSTQRLHFPLSQFFLFPRLNHGSRSDGRKRSLSRFPRKLRPLNPRLAGKEAPTKRFIGRRIPHRLRRRRPWPQGWFCFFLSTMSFFKAFSRCINLGLVSGKAAATASWGVILHLAFQSVGIVYGDIGTSPLYVYASTFTDGIKHNDDVLGVLSLILYTLTLIPLLKYVFFVLQANDNGEGN